MEKKKFRDCFSNEEHWMATAFLIAAKSPSKHAIIAVDNNNNLQASSKEDVLCNSQKYDHVRCVATDILLNCSNITSTSIYMTYTPDYEVICSLATAGVRRIVFFNTKELSEDSQDLIFSNRGMSVAPFAGNLNWIRDYLTILESSGIFA